MTVATRPGLDPRIRARRIEVRRGAGRRRLRRLTWLAVVAGLVLVAVGMTQTPVLAVHKIEIDGTAHLTPAQIRRAAGLRAGNPMIAVSSAAITHRLEALPWVAKATVRRHWPGTITVLITERQPVGQVQAGSNWLVVDRAGRVLEVRPTPAAQLAPIAWSGPRAGLGTTITVSAPALWLSAAIPVDLRASVVAVFQDAQGLGVRLKDGATIRVGSVSALRDKLVAAATVLTSKTAKCADVIDVEIPNAPTLTARSGCA